MSHGEAVAAVTLRDVKDDDCEMLWVWANEPGVRESSFDPRRIGWEEHVDWFRRVRADEQSRIYVVLEAGRRAVGIVRFELDDDGFGVVGINLDPDARGRGVGAEALRLACDRITRDANAVAILAYVKPDNRPSLRAFARAGFTAAGETRVRDVPAVVLRWEPPLPETP